MIIKLLPLASIALLAACCSTPSLQHPITGTWVQPIPGQSGKVQGIQLKDNGQASSVNMHTLCYTSWTQDGNTVTLNGKSLGNQRTLTFSNKAVIKKLTTDTLILAMDGGEETYTRQK
ncbi:MAG: lipocalin family protein [Akkermansia sp.]